MTDDQPYQTVAPPVWWVEGEFIVLGAKGVEGTVKIYLGDHWTPILRERLLDKFDFKKGRP